MKLTLPLPPSVNAYWRIFRNRILLSQEARDFKARVLAKVRPWGHRPLDGGVVVNVVVYRKRRTGDLDNFLKATLDCLKGVAFNDDKQVIEIHARREDDPTNPRVEVRVEEAE